MNELKERIDAALGAREAPLKVRADLLALYGAGTKDTSASRENPVYQYVSLMLPRVIFGQPRVRIRSRRGAMGRAVAQAMQTGINRWIVDARAAETLVELAYDFLFGYSVAMVRQSIMPGDDPADADARHWPAIAAVMPERFFLDPDTTTPGDAEYAGHLFRRRVDDLLAAPAEEGWFPEAILSNAGAVPPTSDPIAQRAGVNSQRGRHLYGYEVWTRRPGHEGPYTERDGYHGTIHTVSVSGQPLRRPRPYWGPPQGPYVVMGCYRGSYGDSGLSPYPMSPLGATLSQIRASGEAADAVAAGFTEYKAIGVVNSQVQGLEEKVAGTPHGAILGVPGFERSMIERVELGGPTKLQVDIDRYLRDRLDRDMGILEAWRGAVTGRATATENSIADSAAGGRAAFIQERYRLAVAGVLRRVAWFLYHDNDVVFPVGDRAGEAMRMFDPIFMGGRHEWESGQTFEDLELSIEPYSMQRVDQQQIAANTMQVLDLVTRLAPAMGQPGVNWRALLDKAGDALNEEDLGTLVDPELIQTMTMGQPLPPPREPPPGPRLTRTYGMPRGERAPAPPPEVGVDA